MAAARAQLATKVATTQGDRAQTLEGCIPALLESVRCLEDLQAVQAYLDQGFADHGLQAAEMEAVLAACNRKLKSAQTVLPRRKQQDYVRVHDVKGADGCLLVELLPKDAQQIPPTLRDRLQLEQLPEDKMPVSFAHLAAFAPRVRLRQTRPAEPREQAWVPQLAHLLNQLQSRSDGGLHNLQIFTPAQTKCPQPQLALTNEAAEPPQTQLAPADAPAAR
ncbi:unnamed protein product, partial [Durusdinium trenchii]